MDKLIAFLNSLEKTERKDFCQSCGTSENYMRKARSAGQKFRGELCVAIERNSRGNVTRKDLRDDWACIWPELADQQNVAASDDTQPPTGGSAA